MIYIVVPCYNEAETLKITVPIFCEKIHTLIKSEKISSLSRILFVDDVDAHGPHGNDEGDGIMIG